MRDPVAPILTRVAGVTFDNRDGSPRQTYIRLVKKDDRLVLAREPLNDFDPNAIPVLWATPDGVEHQLGYVPRALSAVLAPLIDAGGVVTALAVRAQKVPRHGVFAKPVWGLRMALYGDFTELPDFMVSGLEPAVEQALAEDKANPDGGSYAPALGGDREKAPSKGRGPKPTTGT